MSSPSPSIAYTLAFKAPDLPVWLSSLEAVIKLYRAKPFEGGEKGFVIVNNGGEAPSGIPPPHRHTICNVEPEADRAWDAIAALVNTVPDTAVRVPRVHLASRYGFIVMEYVDGCDCALGEGERVAPALAQLHSIRAPTAVPGPVGDGLVANAVLEHEPHALLHAT
ncbi:hypothetical protein C8Q80DRAFT_1265539 [Daedaleopsis nitida]|nr:hypothetical protein C8Q80DRAFT_1265539 [Daedaleopsis nitida]